MACTSRLGFVLCLYSSLRSIGSAARRVEGDGLALAVDEDMTDLPGTPKTAEVGDCGGAAIKNVDSMLGCGADGCAWKVTLADDEAAIIKVAKDNNESRVSLAKDCGIAKKLQEAGVERTLKCLGSCTSEGNPAAVLSPFVTNAYEPGPNRMELGENEKNKHAVVEMLKTTWQMLHGGFVNVDQANNVLYNKETGDPVFIDFGRAMRITNIVTSIKMKMRLQVQVAIMLRDLFVQVPPDLCGLAQSTVVKLQEEMPPADVLKKEVCTVLTGEMTNKWEKCEGTSKVTIPNC